MNYGDYIWDLGGTLLDNYQISTQAFLATLERFERTAEFQAVYDALKVSTSTAIAMFAPDITDFRTLYKQEEAKHLQEPVLLKVLRMPSLRLWLRVDVISWLATAITWC